jgi:rod shape-determining protein MreD
MKKKFVYSLILIVAIIIQTSVLPIISSPNIAGDIVLMVILALSVLDGFFAFMGWAIIAGILYDLAAYSPIGEHAIIFLLVVYFVSFFSRRMSLEIKGIGKVLFFVFVIVATFFSRSIIALMAAWDMQTLHGYWQIFGSLKSITFQIICNEILFFLLFLLLKRIKEFFKLEK